MTTDKKFDLNSIRVASPCSVGWENMTGDERTRHCAQCTLNVYNISALSAFEVEDLIFKSEGRLCIRMYRRVDGTVLTRDCPVGLRAVQKRVARVAGATFGAMLGLLSFSYGQKDDKKQPNPLNSDVVRTAIPSQETELVGFVLDPNGNAIANAEIRLYKGGIKKPFAIKSDSDGAFSFYGLPEGVYTAEAEREGFKKYRNVGITVERGERVSIQISLEPKDGIVMLGILATADSLLETDSSQIATTISERTIQRRPE